MTTLWSLGKKSAIIGVRLFSRLLIKTLNLKHEEPLALFSSEQIETENNPHSY